MTSSLVGSEMCIRDSSATAAAAASPAPPAPSLAASPWASRTDKSGNSPPVSYTHLTLPTICSV
eukprot:971777-Prorocentrum_lima.AAC.1